MDISVQVVTPELAGEWLRLNVVNRTIRPRHVAYFKRVMAGGQFVTTGEPVQFTGKLADGSAKLVNGQHRLMAIYESGLSQTLVVVENVALNAQIVMDSGSKRYFHDVLHLERQVDNARNVAALVKLGWLYDNGMINLYLTGGTKMEILPQDLLAWYDDHPEVKTFQPEAARISKSTQFGATAVGLALLLVDRVAEPVTANEFFERLETGTNLRDGDPILAARNWVTNHRVSRVRAMPRPVIQAAVLVKAWNDWVTGTPRKIIGFRAFSEDFPTPVSGVAE